MIDSNSFVQHNGLLLSISGHVIIVRTHNMVDLMRFSSEFCLPWAFSDEEGYFQFTHPLSHREREEYRWLYHRMDGLKKEVDNVDGNDDDTPPDSPGPMVA